MLKHVSSGSLLRNKTLPARADTISINSSISFSSSNGSGGVDADTSSRSSSSTSIQDIGVQKVMVKIYSKVLCSDVEYKTLSINNQTTSKDVVNLLLNKFRLKHRDPNLFYLTMEIWIRQSGIPMRSVMVLDDDACPSQLQSCYPQKDLKFSLMMRRGGLVKVYDSCLMSGSLYKSLLLSSHTTAEELIQLLLHCYNSKERTSKFSLYEVCPSRKYERRLHTDDVPLSVQNEWPVPDLYVFQLRKNNDDAIPKRRTKLPWTKTLDPLGNVMFHLSGKDETYRE